MAGLNGQARDLLIELGVEELPDRWIARALASLSEVVVLLLDRERLAHGAVRVLTTPRRVAVLVEKLAAVQPDEVKELTGPPERVAVDPQTGEFTNAALKFASRYGVDPGEIRLVDTSKGRVVGITTRNEGRPAREVVASLLPEIFSEKSIPYPQSMYWEAHTGPFIRPVQWLVVLHGSEIVDVELFGVRSGRDTCGHRFHAPGSVSLLDVSSYEEVLEAHHVIVDQTRRRAVLEKGLTDCARGGGADIVTDEDLLEEVVSITEFPVPVLGGFDERFLSIPEQVVITAMAVHQRYFALRDPGTGRLCNAFIAVSNTQPLDTGVVRKGYERVLTARLEDARFCWDEDRRRRLSDLRPGLQGMIFQRGLGTYLDKVERLSKLAPDVLRVMGVKDAVPDALHTAASLCKADLLARVVYEFPELQGIMGGEYARLEGLGHGIPEAIRDHYKPEGPSDDLPETVMGKVLSVADKIDTLTGFFGLGRRPKGGSDPFGLRRACLGVVRIMIALGTEARFSEIIDLAYPLYEAEDLKVSLEQTRQDLLEFLEGRLRVLWSGDARTDLLDACLGCGIDSVIRARRRLDALVEFNKSEEFEDLAVAFKRAYRIVKNEKMLPDALDPSLFEQEEERRLHQAVSAVEGVVEAYITAGDFDNAFDEFRKLRGPVDGFFDNVFVNVDDKSLRFNRLALLSRVVRMIEPAARLDLVQFEKTRL